MRRVVLLLCVAFLVALAGCATVMDGDDGDPGADDTPDDEPTTDQEETDAADEDHTTDDSNADETDGVDPPDGKVEFHHIDVGQADSTLIRTPEGETILIDSGDWRQDGEDVIAYLEDLGVDRIDHLTATHAHADHIGGHEAIIDHYETQKDGIGAIYDSGVPHTTQTYERYLDAVDRHDHEILLVEEGDDLPLDETNLTATVKNPPSGDSGSDLHYNSVSIVFEFGDIRYVTTGDAEKKAEERMVDEWAAELSGDIYHAGHHGSSTSSTEMFMNIVDPDIAIVSSAYESRYGHPHDEVLDRFDAFGITTYWTGIHGDIVVTTDGDSVDVETATDATTDPTAIKDEKPQTNTNAVSPITAHTRELPPPNSTREEPHDFQSWEDVSLAPGVSIHG